MKETKTPLVKSFIRPANYRAWPTPAAVCIAALVGLASVLSVQAYVLDNFNTTRTGWTDTPGACGTFSQPSQQFQIANSCPNNLAYSTKTSTGFANQANQTLEFRVDVISVVPGSGSVNPVSILAWLPSGAVPGGGSTGYSLQATAGGATLYHGATVLATTTYATTDATNNQNTTLVLRMTAPGSGGAGTIDVNARIYRKTGSLPLQVNGKVYVWETTQTVSDSVGTTGYAALGVKSSASGADSVIFDNLQDFVLSDSVLDDFSGGSGDLANYSVTGFGTPTISGGHFRLQTPTYTDAIFVAARRTSPNFTVTDGSRLEIAVDMVNNATGPTDPYAFAVLSYTPANNDSGVQNEVGYHVAPGCFALSSGKTYGEWWVNQQLFPYYAAHAAPVPPSAPGQNMRLIINMTGEGTSCRIESRVEDLNVGVNDPARMLYQAVYVDTAASDPMDTSNSPRYPDGSIGTAAAYLGAPGSIVLYAFFGGNGTDAADVTYANLVVNQTTPPNFPPSISNMVPPDRSNFVAVASSQVTFQVTDDVSIPANNVSLTLNGVTYANGSGATVAGSTASKTFTLNGPLLADTFYSGSIQATDNVGAVTIQNYSFDTFRTNAGTCYTIESEDYNFYGGTNASITEPGPGSFIDNPAIYPDAYGTFDDGYVTRVGYAEVDFHDNRTSPDSGSTYRPSDIPRTAHTGDGPRGEYAIASANWATPVSETVVYDRQDGDWNNYTHAYPAGWYTAYLRMGQLNTSFSAIGLQRVTNPTQTNGFGQTAVDLGVFYSGETGFDTYHIVQLTDGVGKPRLVHFTGGVDTLRVTNTLVQSASPGSGLAQNYLVFAPAANPGPLPPYVSLVTPANGLVLGANSPTTGATIVNQDTTVNTASVIVQVNGVTVSSTTTPTGSGATVTWVPSSASPTLHNALIFKDSANVWQTNTWTYSYGTVLQAASSLPLGSLTVPGFDARFVESYLAGNSAYANIGNGGLPNSVASAQTLLANPPLYTVNLSSTNIVQTVNWDIVTPPTYAGAANFPGLCLPAGGAYTNSFAVEIFAYLQLTAGGHRFTVDSDDAVGVYSGANLADTSTALVQNDAVTHDSMDFFVPADGLYPFHVVYEEGGGAAYLRLQSVNQGNNSTTLLNAPGGVVAYYPLVWKSSSTVTGPYTVDAAANGAGNVLQPTSPNVPCEGTGSSINLSLTGGTNTFALPTAPKFYRIDAPRAAKILSIKKQGSNLVIPYSYQ